MKNVIASEKISKHNIEPYRFKVLGSRIAKKDDEPSEEKFEEPPVYEAPPLVQPKVTQQAVESDFIEELLKKTDELSSNIVNLQLKIESQEQEFERRLTDEIARAKDDGQKIGFESATAQFQASYEQLEAQFQRSITLLEEEQKKFNEFTHKSELELSDAAIDIAKEVLKKEITKDSNSVCLSLSKALMKELKDATRIELKVNRKNYEGAKEFFEQFENIFVSIDDAISEGGVILLSSVGNIDGTITTRLEQIKRMIKE